MPDRAKHATASVVNLKASADPTARSRKRLPPEVRRAQILEAAARLVVEQGYLPLSVEKLARSAGISKGLVYAYFSTQHALCNALLQQELDGLEVAGLQTASQVADLDQAALLCAMLYFEHVAHAGPLLHILLSDRYMIGHIDAPQLAARDRILRRLARLARRALPLSRPETLAAIEMITAIPEEAGSLVFHRELDPQIARRICHTLVLTSIEALRAPDSAAPESARDRS